MEIKKIKYPSEEFYQFGKSEGAVTIGDYEIEKWVNKCVNDVKQQLENGIESPYSYVASGDTMVIVFYSQDCQDDVFDDSNFFEVIVAKNYEEGEFFIQDVKKEHKSQLDEEIYNLTLEEILDTMIYDEEENFDIDNFSISIKPKYTKFKGWKE